MDKKIIADGMPLREAFNTNAEYLEALSVKIHELLCKEDEYIAKIDFLIKEVDRYKSMDKVYKVKIKTITGKTKMIIVSNDISRYAYNYMKENEIVKVSVTEINLMLNKDEIILKR